MTSCTVEGIILYCTCANCIFGISLSSSTSSHSDWENHYGLLFSFADCKVKVVQCTNGLSAGLATVVFGARIKIEYGLRDYRSAGFNFVPYRMYV